MSDIRKLQSEFNAQWNLRAIPIPMYPEPGQAVRIQIFSANEKEAATIVGDDLHDAFRKANAHMINVRLGMGGGAE